MAEPATHTVTIDLPAGVDAAYLAEIAPYIEWLGMAVFCAFIASISATVLSRSRKVGRKPVVVLSAAISMAAAIVLCILSARIYWQPDPFYLLAQILFALPMFFAIALSISAPLAWVVSRRCRILADRQIFE
jgi:peptidoglycan/LPS O-acetylase OafA/YrhL